MGQEQGDRLQEGCELPQELKPFPPHMPVLAFWRRRGCGKPQGPLPCGGFDLLIAIMLLFINCSQRTAAQDRGFGSC